MGFGGFLVLVDFPCGFWWLFMSFVRVFERVCRFFGGLTSGFGFLFACFTPQTNIRG